MAKARRLPCHWTNSFPPRQRVQRRAESVNEKPAIEAASEPARVFAHSLSTPYLLDPNEPSYGREGAVVFNELFIPILAPQSFHLPQLAGDSSSGELRHQAPRRIPATYLPCLSLESWFRRGNINSSGTRLSLSFLGVYRTEIQEQRAHH
ncbi:hypothetical protein EDC04DRAFT_1681616 [Pisolithus marmoratus]|nr:hypothetical protein EDC04DRAFT_1681616 [Pisolithus marmoratus]